MNTDTTEPAKTLGQLAQQAFREFNGNIFTAQEQIDEGWNGIAQAVLQKFLSAGPVSAQDVLSIMERMPKYSLKEQASFIADCLNSTLRIPNNLSRHANPVQVEGGWEEFTGEEGNERGYLRDGCQVLNDDGEWVNIGGRGNFITDRTKRYRRRIPNQPAYGGPPPKLAEQQKQLADALQERFGEEQPTAVASGSPKEEQTVGSKMMEKVRADMVQFELAKNFLAALGYHYSSEGWTLCNPTAAQGQGELKLCPNLQPPDGAMELANDLWETMSKAGVVGWRLGYVASRDLLESTERRLTASQARVAFLEGQCDQHRSEQDKLKESMRADLEAMKGWAEKAEAFKAYVHQRLDAMGVPTDPESPHKAEGCRVGGRLDWLTAQSAELSKEIERLKKWLSAKCDRIGGCLLVMGSDSCGCVNGGTDSSREDTCARLTVERDKALAEVERLTAFKTYVHQRLDAMGVPVDPDSSHKAEGCRIGGRLDWIDAQLRSRGGVLIKEDGRRIFYGYTLKYSTCDLLTQEVNCSLQSPWRTIIAGDPASLPQIGDGKYVIVKWHDRVGINPWDAMENVSHWMPLPPLPTPKASAEGEGFEQVWWKVGGTDNNPSKELARLIWQAARAPQAVEGKAL